MPQRKSHSSERKPHHLSKSPAGSQGTTQSREQDRAVKTREIQGQDLSFLLTVSFYDSLNADEALDLLFHHLFYEPNSKEHLEQLTVDL